MSIAKKDDKKLKRNLILQSFFPLFLLLFIQHAGHWELIYKFFSGLLRDDFSVINRAFINQYFGDVVISLTAIIWMLFTLLVALGFRNYWISGYESHGETIIIGNQKKDTGVTFLVSFVLPLLIDDVSTFRGLLFFTVLLVMVIFLLMKSDLFYQNPVLIALGYKIFEFKFMVPYRDVDDKQIYIGICRKNIPGEGNIKRKLIADDIYAICND